MKIYQLIAYVNGWNKKTKKWESLHHFNKFYVGKEGLSTAHFEKDKQMKEYEFAMTCLPSKYYSHKNNHNERTNSKKSRVK